MLDDRLCLTKLGFGEGPVGEGMGIVNHLAHASKTYQSGVVRLKLEMALFIHQL